MSNLHSFDFSWGVTLIIAGIVLIFLPLNEIVQFINGESHIGLFAWSVLQLGLAFLVIGWGADIVWYRDKRLSEHD